MNEFFDTATDTSEVKDHEIWPEKYAPKTLEDFRGEQSFIEVMEEYIKNETIPNMMFYSKSGGFGKTALAKILVNNIKCDFLAINASKENGIDFIREKIAPFAERQGFEDLKIVLLDEADYLSSNSQASLRNLIDNTSIDTRYIFTCNYIEKIIPQLESRLQVHQFKPCSKAVIAERVAHIFSCENIEYEMKDLKKLVETYYPDFRKTLNCAQQMSVFGKLDVSTMVSEEFEFLNYLLSYLKDGNDNVTQLRQNLVNADIREFEKLYDDLFKNMDVYATSNAANIIILLAKYAYENSLSINKDITFLACVCKIKQLLNV